MFAPGLPSLSHLYFESGDLFQPGYPTPQSAEDDWPSSLERWACPAVIVTVVHGFHRECFGKSGLFRIKNSRRGLNPLIVLGLFR